MIGRFFLFFSVCLLLGCASTNVKVCFTPGENCSKRIIDELDKSKKSIYIQAYEFTAKSIADSVIQAKERGVDVKVILDKSQIHSKYSVIDKLYESGIPIWIDFRPAIAHNKIMIIDEHEVITGSFNFTDSAQLRNAENLLVIDDDNQLVEQYLENWKNRQSKSKIYQPNDGS